MSRLASFSLLLPLLASAALTPTGPGPNDVFKEGQQCTVSWTADTTGAWKTAFIELMTGPNQNMVHLTTVAQIDGTDAQNTSLSWTCPQVTPNAAIYFYQFTAQGQPPSWTTRWTIAGPNGETVPPPNQNQPNGDSIPWGVGSFVAPFKGSPPPPTAPGGQQDASQGGAPVNTTASALPSSTANATNSASGASSVSPTTSVPDITSGVSTAVTTSSVASPSASGGNSTASGGKNAAASNGFSSAGVLVTVASVLLATLAF